jgi:zinc protease
VFKEIAALQADGPSERQVNDTRAGFLRDYETNVKQNSYLLSQIYLKYQHGEDLADFFNLPEHYKSLTAGMIQEAARTYLKKDNHVRVTLLPEVQEQKDQEKAPAAMPAPERMAAGALR